MVVSIVRCETNHGYVNNAVLKSRLVDNWTASYVPRPMFKGVSFLGAGLSHEPDEDKEVGPGEACESAHIESLLGKCGGQIGQHLALGVASDAKTSHRS